MEIRKYNKNEISAIVDLWVENMNFHSRIDEVLQLSEEARAVFENHLRRIVNDEKRLFLIATDGQKIFGFIHGAILEYPKATRKRYYGNILDIYVIEEYRDQGIGTQLLEQTKAWFKSKGIDRLEARILIDNEVAQGFWRKSGFKDYIIEKYINI